MQSRHVLEEPLEPIVANPVRQLSLALLIHRSMVQCLRFDAASIAKSQKVKEIAVSVRLSHSHDFAFDAASKRRHGIPPSSQTPVVTCVSSPRPTSPSSLPFGDCFELLLNRVLNMADHKVEEISTECAPVKKLKVEVESVENDASVHKGAISLSNFQMKRLLNVNSARKQVFVEGIFTGHDNPAIVILEKKSFPVEEIFLNRGFFNEGTIIRKLFRNGIYGNYECFPTREYNGINATVIHPASQSHLEKYSVKELHLVEETYEIYKNVTLPHIELQNISLEWVDNILQHKAEEDKIIFEDKNVETGFLMVPDLKWDGTPESLCVLALSIKRIKSIRELNGSHLPLLKNVREAGINAIFKKYKVPESRLRIYLHYRPSYYHLHVHFTYLMYEGPGTFVEKAHLLSTVIQNIELMPDYYQKATLSFAVAENDPLYKKYQEHGVLPLEINSVKIS